MSNPRFDIDHWCKTFPATEIGKSTHRDLDKYWGVPVTGPREMALNLHIRKELWPDLDPASGVAADVFVWAIGEGGNPAATKIGGMPYLPRSVAWPTLADGRPMEFVAQLNLADSIDLLPALPGDLLLIFCETSAPAFRRPRVAKRPVNKGFLKRIQAAFKKDTVKEEPPQYYLTGDFAFVWVDTAKHGPQDIIAREDAPNLPFFLRPLHGQIVRSSDHQDLYDGYCEEKEAFAAQAKEEYLRTRDPNEKTEMPEFLKPLVQQLGIGENAKFVDSDAWRASLPDRDKPWELHYNPPAVLKGTKIGGVPVWDQGHAFSEWGKSLGQPGGVQFIGQLRSDTTNLTAPHPYVGRAAPFESSWDERYYTLTIADVGALYLFWDGEQVQYEIQGG